MLVCGKFFCCWVVRGCVMLRCASYGAVVLILAVGWLTTSAKAQNFSKTIFFGDSNTDSGRFLYISPVTGTPIGLGKAPPGTGAFTTNPDPEWSVILGSKFGIAVTPSDAPGGGNNYAAGGARVAAPVPGRLGEWSAQQQVAAYLASTGGVADPNALYTVYIGINDLKTSSIPNIIGNTAEITALGTFPYGSR